MFKKAKRKHPPEKPVPPSERIRLGEVDTLRRNIRLQKRVASLAKQLKRATAVADEHLRSCWFQLETFYGENAPPLAAAADRPARAQRAVDAAAEADRAFGTDHEG